MITSEEQAKARYKQVERESDALGRIIGVRRLRPSEMMKVTGLTPDLGEVNIKEIDVEGTTQQVGIPDRAPLLMAAMVCEISVDGELARIPFPKTRAELDGIYDRLDVWGLQAASIAISRLTESDVSVGSIQETAKNS